MPLTRSAARFEVSRTLMSSAFPGGNARARVGNGSTSAAARAALRKVVVQSRRDPGTLVFLCLHQFSAERGGGLPRRSLVRDVDRGADVPGEDAVDDAGHAAAQDPSVFAIVVSEPVLHRER